MKNIKQKIKERFEKTRLGRWLDRNFDFKYFKPILVYELSMILIPTIAFVIALAPHGLFDSDLTVIENYLNTLGFEGLLSGMGSVLILTYILTFLFTAISGRKIIKEHYFKATSINLLKTIGITFCVFYFFNQFGCDIVAKIMEWIGISATTSENQMLIELLLGHAGLQMTALVVIGSIVEEFIFRCCLMNFIKNRKVASWVSAITFGVMHISTFALSEFIMLFVYVGLGWLFVAIYNKTDDIRVSTGVHFLNNLLSAILSI